MTDEWAGTGANNFSSDEDDDEDDEDEEGEEESGARRKKKSTSDDDDQDAEKSNDGLMIASVRDSNTGSAKKSKKFLKLLANRNWRSIRHEREQFVSDKLKSVSTFYNQLLFSYFLYIRLEQK